MPEKTRKFKLGLKNLAMLPSYFDYYFVHLRQKVRLRPELSPKILSTLGPNPTRKARPDLQLCAVPHNIVFSCKKSVGVLFPSKGFVLPQSPKIILGNTVINFSDSVTYFGVVKIFAKFCDDENMFRQVRSVY